MNAGRMRVVLDTNVLVSAAYSRKSQPGRCLDLLVDHGRLLFSRETLEELKSVLWRPKFNQRLSEKGRLDFVDAVERMALLIRPLGSIQICRDPTDNIVLEIAVSGSAAAIVTGDKDLRVPHPFKGIPVLSPSEFLIAAPTL